MGHRDLLVNAQLIAAAVSQGRLITARKQGFCMVEMHVNPELILPESDYTNNTGAVKFQFTAKHGNTGPSIQLLP